MDRRVALLQSNYIPWKGYFDIVASVDVFIFHDDLQYTKQDWRNRNRIKTPRGVRWLTIPCGSDENRTVAEVRLEDPSWQRQHWNRIVASYGSAPCFGRYAGFFEDVYLGRRWENLSELNQFLIRRIASEFLQLATVFDDSRRHAATARKAARVLEILESAGASVYVSGPAAKAYLDERELARRGIAVEWMDYSGYPEYEQPYPPFEHGVSIIDLLFCTGQRAKDYMKGARR